MKRRSLVSKKWVGANITLGVATLARLAENSDNTGTSYAMDTVQS